MKKYQPHIIVLVEDKADRQIVNGFLLTPFLNERSIKVEDESGGWGKVVKEFDRNYIKDMEIYQYRHMVLVIDFDMQVNRRAEIVQTIPEHIRDRVFIVGAWSNPERLRDALGMNLESIGKALAKDCVEGTSETWSSELLAHNAEELARMREKLKPILFS